MYEQNSALMRCYFIYMSRDICLKFTLNTAACLLTQLHTHIPHVIVNTHALISLNVPCICHFQKLSFNQDVIVQEYIWTLQNIFFSVNIFYICVRVSKATIGIQGLPPAGKN